MLLLFQFEWLIIGSSFGVPGYGDAVDLVGGVGQIDDNAMQAFVIFERSMV